MKEGDRVSRKDKPKHLEHDFSSKMVSYLKQLLKYKLQENVEYFYFYADYFRIAYNSKDKNCEIIENARSGQPEKGGFSFYTG